jgi:hypothetical protein
VSNKAIFWLIVVALCIAAYVWHVRTQRLALAQNSQGHAIAAIDRRLTAVEVAVTRPDRWGFSGQLLKVWLLQAAKWLAVLATIISAVRAISAAF